MFSAAVMNSGYCEMSTENIMYRECYYLVVMWPKSKENVCKEKI